MGSEVDLHRRGFTLASEFMKIFVVRTELPVVKSPPAALPALAGRCVGRGRDIRAGQRETGSSGFCDSST